MLGRKILAIQVILTEDGYHPGCSILLNEKGNKITIESKKTINSLEELDFNVPIIICVLGKGLLVKSSTVKINNIQEALQSVLPSSKESEFLVQKIDTLSGSTVAIVRKDKIDTIIKDFRRKGLFIVDISLSPLEIKYLEPLINGSSLNEICTGTYLIKISNGQIIEVVNDTLVKNENISIAGFDLEQEYVLPFSSAISYILKNELLVLKNNFEELLKEKKQSNYANKTKQIVFILGLFLLSILILNTGFNVFYNSKINQQEPLVIQSEAQIKEKETLKKQLNLLEKMSGGENIRLTNLSFYADRIASTLPITMQLTELKLNPFFNEREIDSLNFRVNEIKISGKINNAEALNTWLNNLQKQSWCNKVVEQNFEQTINENSGKFNVKIDVQ